MKLKRSSNKNFGKIEEMNPLLLSIWLFVGVVPAFAPIAATQTSLRIATTDTAASGTAARRLR